MRTSLSRDIGTILIVLVVFSLAALMILSGYDPGVTTAAVISISVAAAELVRRINALSRLKHRKSPRRGGLR